MLTNENYYSLFAKIGLNLSAGFDFTHIDSDENQMVYLAFNKEHKEVVQWVWASEAPKYSKYYRFFSILKDGIQEVKVSIEHLNIGPIIVFNENLSRYKECLEDLGFTMRDYWQEINVFNESLPSFYFLVYYDNVAEIVRLEDIINNGCKFKETKLYLYFQDTNTARECYVKHTIEYK